MLSQYGSIRGSGGKTSSSNSTIHCDGTRTTSKQGEAGARIYCFINVYCTVGGDKAKTTSSRTSYSELVINSDGTRVGGLKSKIGASNEPRFNICGMERKVITRSRSSWRNCYGSSGCSYGNVIRIEQEVTTATNLDLENAR